MFSHQDNEARRLARREQKQKLERLTAQKLRDTKQAPTAERTAASLPEDTAVRFEAPDFSAEGIAAAQQEIARAQEQVTLPETDLPTMHFQAPDGTTHQPTSKKRRRGLRGLFSK